MSGTGAQTESADYKRGYDAGKAARQPNIWAWLISLCGGLVFLLMALGCWGVPQDLYNAYKDYQLKQDRIAACASAPDVTACIKAVG